MPVRRAPADEKALGNVSQQMLGSAREMLFADP